MHAPATAAYLDWASTAPLHPAAREALLTALDLGWADPSRLYGSARRARAAFDAAREQVGALIGARADEVWFPSSGTQAVHLAVLGAAAGRHRAGRDIVVSAVEHSSVLHAAAWAASANCPGVPEGAGRVVTAPVHQTGRIDVPAFTAAVQRPGVALAALQSVNHEVGTWQPTDEIAAACAQQGVPLLIDAAQSIGRYPVPACWDLLTASAHKWGGPAGVGVLAIRSGVRWRNPGPEDERGNGRVSGFENLPAVLAAAAALAACEQERTALAVRLGPLAERIRREVPRLIPDAQVMGDPDPAGRAPHLVTFSCLYVPGEALLVDLDRAQIAVSSGSSCTSSAVTPSHVLVAMGVLSHGNIRVSFGRGSSDAEVDYLLAVLPPIVARLRADAGVSQL